MPAGIDPLASLLVSCSYGRASYGKGISSETLETSAPNGSRIRKRLGATRFRPNSCRPTHRVALRSPRDSRLTALYNQVVPACLAPCHFSNRMRRSRYHPRRRARRRAPRASFRLATVTTQQSRARDGTEALRYLPNSLYLWLCVPSPAGQAFHRDADPPARTIPPATAQ